jgi:hypothetical protein
MTFLIMAVIMNSIRPTRTRRKGPTGELPGSRLVDSAENGNLITFDSKFFATRRILPSHMRIWHLLLILLLSVAVPTYGLAAGVVLETCPAHADMSMEAPGVSSPCCDHSGGSGKLPDDACATHCSVASGCGGVQFVQPAAVPMPAMTAGEEHWAGTSSPIAAPDPFGVWRPPRLL